MSHDTIPKALREQLRKLADADCAACGGDGIARATQARCACCLRPKEQ